MGFFWDAVVWSGLACSSCVGALLLTFFFFESSDI